MNYVTLLKSTMQKLCAVPPRIQDRKSYVDNALSSCTHVFVRQDTVRAPLQQPYNGPYEVVKSNSKHFTVIINGHNQVISDSNLHINFGYFSYSN